MQNADELIEKYKNDMLKMMKRSYFPYENDGENEPNVSAAATATSDGETAVNPDSGEIEESYGSLKVRVFSGNIAFPIETAFVRILDLDGKVVTEGYTDQSGIFDAVMLPAPNKIISETPGSEQVYTGYGVVVTHPRFNTEVFENVPVFADIESIQDVRMQPGRSEDREVTVESEPENLRRSEDAR